ncbi:hypothetical protein [Moritella sp.]|uniref:hypothetical protein n=1 Tax=Moritella sp. TaxID=78556 RepID=UPI0025F439A1|nr:hypothetical protein [Moritella sp.]
MNKIVLMMILCVSLQGCSNGAGSSKSEDLSTVGETARTAKEKNQIRMVCLPLHNSWQLWQC